MTEIHGIAFDWFETGTEGVVWVVQDERHISTKEDGSPSWSYDGLKVLRDGDHLTLYAKDGSVTWEGVIDFDMEIGYTPYPMNPEYGQQAIDGWWVHGVQRGINPSMWLQWFRDNPRAKLIPRRPN